MACLQAGSGKPHRKTDNTPHRKVLPRSEERTMLLTVRNVLLSISFYEVNLPDLLAKDRTKHFYQYVRNPQRITPQR